MHRSSAHRFEDRFFKVVTNRANVAILFCEIFAGELGRFSKANNSCDVFRPAASSVFLAPACDQRREAGSPIDVKRAYAFWAMELVRGKGKEIDRRIAQAHRNFSDGLHSVGMKEHAFSATNFSDFLDWK